MRYIGTIVLYNCVDYMCTPTIRFWSVDFHITVVQIIILVIILKQNFKIVDTPIFVFTPLQRIAVFAIDRKSNGLVFIFFSIEPRSNGGGDVDRHLIASVNFVNKIILIFLRLYSILMLHEGL